MAGESNSEAMQNFSAFASNVLMKDTLESARRTTQMADQALGMTLKGMVELDPTQAISQVKAFTGFDNASQSVIHQHDLGEPHGSFLTSCMKSFKLLAFLVT